MRYKRLAPDTRTLNGYDLDAAILLRTTQPGRVERSSAGLFEAVGVDA
jgi:hypothetical protein